jgi:BirA family biotin operon repressor/biotin-[acetyl-CoA-carboxylase] ligase
VIGARVVRYAEIESTNDAAARLAEQGEPEGTVVVAERQLRGRGRQGRPWHSPPGTNLYCSVILRPARPHREWPDLSWTLAAAVAETCREAGAAAVSLKYPNDVVSGGRKLAGLLLETRTGPSATGALIAGIGLNVNSRSEDLPPELRGSATSLAILTGRAHDPAALLERLLARLERWYGAWSRGGAEEARRLLAESGIPTTAGERTPRGALDESAPALPAGA